MPKRTDLQTILLIGSGPIVIGQGAEFDYSGTQAVRALKEEGYRVVLVNSNPATIMTDPELADRTYIEPVTPEWVAKVIERERPDALLPTMGGQTALNVAMALQRDGTLERYCVELIGANERAIRMAEDREEFAGAMRRIGLATPQGRTVRSVEEAMEAVEVTGFPAILRPSFTLGGTGGGIAYNIEEFETLIRRGLELSPVGSVLVERSIIGWKEFELEVMRDGADNVVIVCSIENFDPMGVHTGDSITVAPAMTLTDREYQVMRDAAIRIIREIGVAAGGCNIQFAVDPATGEQLVIEMNPRVSRSSALASKATGFPIARIGTKVAVGYRLDELPNDITRTTPASFEPVLDYVVVKIPRFAFEKFPTADPTLTTQMKSVGEVMAIGRTFKEAFQKGLRGLEADRHGWVTAASPADDRVADATLESALAAMRTPTPERVFQIKRALQLGAPVEAIAERTGIDAWFLYQLAELVEAEKEWAGRGSLGNSEEERQSLRRMKRLGFSDRQLAELRGTNEAEVRVAAPSARHPARVQDGGHLCRRVSLVHTLPLLVLRRRERGPRRRRPHGRDPRQWPQPDRPGRGVRLLLRARRHGVPAAGVPHGHGELESGDRLDGLRHLRCPLLRTAHPRGCAGDRPRRTAARRRGAARGPDAAAAGAGARTGGRPDPGHLARGDRPCRGPRTIRGADPGAGRGAAAERRRALGRGGGGRRGPRGIPGAGAALLCPGRPGDGDRLRRHLASRATSSGRRGWRPSIRSSSTASSRTPSRRTWMPSPTAPAASSAE